MRAMSNIGDTAKCGGIKKNNDMAFKPIIGAKCLRKSMNNPIGANTNSLVESLDSWILSNRTLGYLGVFSFTEYL